MYTVGFSINIINENLLVEIWFLQSNCWDGNKMIFSRSFTCFHLIWLNMFCFSHHRFDDSPSKGWKIQTLWYLIYLFLSLLSLLLFTICFILCSFSFLKLIFLRIGISKLNPKEKKKELVKWIFISSFSSTNNLKKTTSNEKEDRWRRKREREREKLKLSSIKRNVKNKMSWTQCHVCSIW